MAKKPLKSNKSKTNSQSPSKAVASPVPITSPAPTTRTTSYDAVPYPSHPYAASHPDRLFSIATLFNLNPVPPEQARVLELGCASGGNLIPIACQFPNATCVGVDLSHTQIAEGQQAIHDLGLKNLRLLQADIAALPGDLGEFDGVEFDYIICHGVFSWVPAHVQRAIMEINAKHLSPRGVSYISYNTLPGWYMRSMVRGMMLKHAGSIEDPAMKVLQARALLQFLVESTESDKSPFANYLRSEAELLGKHSDQYLFHDHLEECNSPMFFQDFVQQAASHGLQFLGEASLPSMWIGNLSPKAVQTLDTLTNDVVLRGQYSDFVCNRTFRQTLLCHRDSQVDRQLNTERIRNARFQGRLSVDTSASGEITLDQREAVFLSTAGHRVATHDPIYKAMIFTLSEAYPSSVSLEELCDRIRERLAGELRSAPANWEVSREAVGGMLLSLLLSGVIDFRFAEDRFRLAIGDRPHASAWSRWQAARGNQVTSLQHQTVSVCDVTRMLLGLCDGTRTRREIVEEMARMVAAGKLALHSETKLDETERIRVLDQISNKLLTTLSANAFLCPGVPE